MNIIMTQRVIIAVPFDHHHDSLRYRQKSKTGKYSTHPILGIGHKALDFIERDYIQGEMR